MSLLSRLFGGGSSSAPEAEATVYKDCRIIPEANRDGGKYRLSARIEKDFDGETKAHMLIRADSLDSFDEASVAAIRKAKQVIDEQGDDLFRGR